MHKAESAGTPFVEHLGRAACAPRTQPYGDLFISVVRGALPGAYTAFAGGMLALWQEDGHTTLVFETPHEQAVRAHIAESCPAAEFLWEGRMPYGNWEAGARVAPAHLAGFLICPCWDVCEPAPCETRIVLDPGLAFGTGLHPATQISLALLRSALERVRPRRVLDLGCGTGVLAIAALLSGADHAAAVDNSLLAVNAARINAGLNNVAHRMQIIQDDIFNHLDRDADLVLCNINFPVIKKLLDSDAFMAHRWILLSGINPEAFHLEISAGLTRAGRIIARTERRGAWFGYLTHKP